MTIHKPLLVLSVPRSTSTALERAFIQRENCHCFHEPFGEPYYYGPERLSDRYNDEQRAASGYENLTYQDIINQIKSKSMEDPGRLIFIKDMAAYLVKPELMDQADVTNPTILSDDQLKEFRYAFLVRSPRKAITSYYRATIDNDCGDFGEFDPSEAGFKELHAMMKYVRKLNPDDGIALIDSDDLVNNPGKTLHLLCDKVGIPFEDNMLSWESKRIEEFDKWKGFHEDAQNSTGFKAVKRDKIDLPDYVEEAIRDNEETYNQLLKYALK